MGWMDRWEGGSNGGRPRGRREEEIEKERGIIDR